MFDPTLLSEEDRQFIAEAQAAERRQKLEYMKSMLPAAGVVVLVGFGPTVVTLLSGYFSPALSFSTFLVGVGLGAKMFSGGS